MTQREEDAEAYSSAVYDSRWSRNRICRKPGTYRKRKEPGDFASDSFLLKGEIHCGNSSLSEAFGEIAGKIEGSFSKILLDAAQEMRGSGGSNLTEILEHCIQKNIYLQNFAGAHKNEEEGIEILQTLGRRLGYLDREQQICQIELLEAETEERRRQLREKLPEQKKICQSLGILGGILLAVLFW